MGDNTFYPSFNTGLADGTTMALGQHTSQDTVAGTAALLTMRGWLLKRKRGCFDPKNKSIFCPDFNKRFFWIDSSIRLIYYSESQDKSKRVSFIPFNKLLSVTTVTEPMAINSARPGWVYGMEVRTTDRAYELWAKTASEAKRWLEVLEKAASIGRSYIGAPGISSATSHYLDTVSPIPHGSRRGSSLSEVQANTVPVVAAPTAPIESKENKDFNVSVRSPKGATIRSPPKPEIPVLAPTKWEDW